jgi:di/tricarboxylate transporter
MTVAMGLSFAVIGLTMVGFVAGQLRYDLVAVLGLLLAIGLGLVPAQEAFSGFSDDIVIIVGSALIVSAGVSRSGIMEDLVRRIAPNVTKPRLQLLLLIVVVAALSAIMKNIGALALMIPIAYQMARRSGVSPSMFLMPMSFAALLGGLVTQVGTSPNIIVSRVRESLTGEPFHMFDFTASGLALAGAGVVFLSLFYWLLPARQRAGLAVNEAIEITNYTTEALVLEGSAIAGATVADLHKLANGRAMVTTIRSAADARRVPLPDVVLRAGDQLLLEGEPEALDLMIAQAGLRLRERGGAVASEDQTIEAVIGPVSPLRGRTAAEYALHERTGLSLLAVSRREQRFTERLGNIALEAGDVVLLRGPRARLGEDLRGLDCLPLADRDLKLGSARNRLLPLGILLAAMAITAAGLVPVGVAFFGAAVLMVLTGGLPMVGLYRALDGPILVMLAALIPVSDTLRTSGATDLIAHGLSTLAATLPAHGALALILVSAMAVTPFLNNAATVLVMAPIAASFAGDLGLRPEAFLMAVAIGAGSDFLTPVGHQCNTLVMGSGGYRFSDYWRLGLPLSILVMVISVPLLPILWPFQ